MSTRPDPITVEIIRNAFISIAEDMNAALIRSAYSPIIYEGKDCAVAVLDEHGDVLAQSLGVPLFLGNLEACVKLTAQRFGWDYFKPGDVFYVNDSYMTGTHLNDATIFAPIFLDDEELVGFSATRAHWLDVGAKDPGSSTDASEIYQEGMRWGPTRIYENFKAREETLDLLRRNSRFGYVLIGDLHAQVTAVNTCDTRLKELISRYGLETVRQARDEIFRQSEELERAAVSQIPDGVYEAEGSLDSDGRGNGPVPVKVRITVSGDQIALDLTGSSPQMPGPVNAGFAQTISGARVAFKWLIHPERPVDGGTFKTFTITAPEKTIFHAQEPAPCQWYFTPQGLMIDLIVKALAPAMPDKVAAAHYGDSMVNYFAGKDPRRGGTPFLSVDPNQGGWGAFNGSDGQDTMINAVNGAYKDFPIEVYENKFPIMVSRYGIRPDTGGPGKFRGGNGLFRQFELETDVSMYLWFERSVTTGWGLFGGMPGAGPDVVVNPGSQDERHMLKANGVALKAGDTVLLLTGGGGGYGLARERDPQRVQADVRNRMVTRGEAERTYGVVLREDLSIDQEATMARRAAT